MKSELTGRFGAELEFNSLDCRDFIKNPLKNGESPLGMVELAQIVSDLGLSCEIHDWRYNHNPRGWSCKPDRSCGIELCSPVLDSENEHQLFEVVDAISGFRSVCFDDRCSFHVHVELASMDSAEAASAILAWWIKCEHVFFDFAVPSRKNNIYCRPIGLTDLFSPDEKVFPCDLLKKLSRKHYSANAFHFFNRRRPTLEFRIAEGTLDCFFAKMWTKTILLFCDRALSGGIPSDYLWLPPGEVLEFMRMDSDLEAWFLERLCSNVCRGGSECFSPKNRKHALKVYVQSSGRFINS